MTMQRAGVTTARRSLAILVLGAAALVAPATAQQNARVTTTASSVKVVVVPFTRLDRDSALSVQVANTVRDRLRLAFTDRFNAVEKRLIDTNLVSSGFPVDMPLDPTSARQLARVLNARLLIEGVIIQLGDDSVEIVGRLSEVTPTLPQSASAAVRIERRRVGNATGNVLANQLADAFRSFEPAKQCEVYRQAQDFTRAMAAANDALRRSPNSSQALLCRARVMQGQNAPADSVIRVLKQAQNADSMNVVAQWQLARYYEERGDTANLILSMHHILIADPNNNEVRIALAQLHFRRSEPDSSVRVLNEGLERNPNQADLLDMRARVQAASGRWSAAAADLVRVSELDTAKVDSAFVVRMVNYFQEAHDTTNLTAWVRRATERYPTPNYWYQLTLLLRAKSDTAGAATAIRGYLRMLPSDGRGNLVYSTILLDLGQPDSAADRAKAAGQSDSLLRGSASQVLFAVGVTKLRAQDWPATASLLGQAKDWARADAAPRIQYYLGLSQLQLAVAADNEAQAAGAREQVPARCDAARREADLLNQAEANITAGGRTDPDRAQQFLTQAIPAYRQRATAFSRNARCPAQ
jgi:lipopolysaccharide biosynthesis regulator YciM